MKLLTNRAFFADHLQPLQVEHDSLSLKVSGEIPLDIKGIYYRNGPNSRFKPNGFHHLVDGDGMVHSFCFNEGAVTYTNKWVNTFAFELESKAKRSLFASFLYPTLSDSIVRMLTPDKRSKANTNIILQGGKLFAFEESALPYELDPISLHTLSQLSVNHKKLVAISAHPKIDPITKKMYSINWHGLASLPDCSYTVFAENGDLLEYHEIKAPYRGMIHDISMTENFIIIPVFPLIVDVENSVAKRTASLLNWQPDLNSYIGILPKNDPNKLVWYSIKNCFMLHACNAFEENGLINLDLIIHDTPPIFCEMDANVSKATYSQLQRWIINTNVQSVKYVELDSKDFIYNFPKVANRNVGVLHDKIYFCGAESAAQEKLLVDSNLLVSFDSIKQTKQVYKHGDNYVASEPVLITTDKQNYLASIWYNKANDTSELTLHFENDLDLAPLAIVHIPHRIPYGFHGNWYEGVI